MLHIIYTLVINIPWSIIIRISISSGLKRFHYFLSIIFWNIVTLFIILSIWEFILVKLTLAESHCQVIYLYFTFVFPCSIIDVLSLKSVFFLSQLSKVLFRKILSWAFTPFCFREFSGVICTSGYTSIRS